MMKNVGICMALIVSFLLTLSIIFVGINSAPAAYAATTSTHRVALTPTPLPTPQRVDCGSSPNLIIVADNYANKDCFGGFGQVSVAIYNVNWVAVYNNHAATIYYHYDGDLEDTQTTINSSNPAIVATNRTINIVKEIDISCC